MSDKKLYEDIRGEPDFGFKNSEQEWKRRAEWLAEQLAALNAHRGGRIDNPVFHNPAYWLKRAGEEA